MVILKSAEVLIALKDVVVACCRSAVLLCYIDVAFFLFRGQLLKFKGEGYNFKKGNATIHLLFYHPKNDTL